VAKQTEKRGDTKQALAEMRRELASKIAAHAQAAGEHSTAIAALVLLRRTSPTACYRAAYEPSLTVFAQGRKRISLGGTVYLCDASSFLLSSIDVPVQSQIVEASDKVPLLSMFLRLDMPTVREVLSREDLPNQNRLLIGGDLQLGKQRSACWEHVPG
jgi:AraC-type transcriptional regulator N-terminus